MLAFNLLKHFWKNFKIRPEGYSETSFKTARVTRGQIPIKWHVLSYHITRFPGGEGAQLNVSFLLSRSKIVKRS